MTSEERHRFEVEQCRANPQMDSYNNFWDIPDDEISELSLVAWLVAGGKLDQIPDKHRSNDVLWTAARHDRDSYKLIGRYEVTDHRELSLEAIRLGHADFEDVPGEYIDEDFLIEVNTCTFGRKPSKTLLKARPELITERVVKAICSRSISKARDFCAAGGDKAAELMKDEYLVKAIRNQISDAESLVGMGKAHVLTGMLAEGFWPAYRTLPNQIAVFRVPPSTPAEALDRLCTKLSPGDRTLHRCWLQSKPTNEVVAALQGSQKGLDELFAIYPERELRKHMKSNRALSGRFLENDLGM